METSRLKEFFISYGMMCLGVFLVVFCSVFFLPASFERNGAKTTISAAYTDAHPLSCEDASANEKTDNHASTSGGDIFTASLPNSSPIAPLIKNKDIYDRNLTAASAVILDYRTKNILFEKSARETRPLASITKLISVLVLLDLQIDWTATTTITDDDCVGGDHHLEVGESYTLDDLWHVALIGSSNSAIKALVRNSGLSEDSFIERMNKKVADLRLSSTYFSEPTGLSEKNMASAIEVAKLLREALRYEKIYTVMQIGEYYAHPLGGKARRVWSTNWLINKWIPSNYDNESVVGKTGYITDSGYNFAASFTGKNKHEVLVVILGAQSNESRFTEASDLADWAFDHYLWPEESGYEGLSE